jgi:hypothetical protein
VADLVDELGQGDAVEREPFRIGLDPDLVRPPADGGIEVLSGLVEGDTLVKPGAKP